MKNDRDGRDPIELSRDSSVRVDLARERHHQVDPVRTDGFEEDSRRGGMALIIVMVALVVVGALVLAGRDDPRSASDEALIGASSTTSPSDDEQDPAGATEAVDALAVDQGAPPPTGINNIVEVSGQWFALADPAGGRLLTSVDGQQWAPVDDTGVGQLVALGVADENDGDSLIGVFQRRLEPTDEAIDQVRLEVASFDAGSRQWLTASQRASVEVPDSQSIAVQVHEGNVVALVQMPWDAPVPAVSEVLAELTSSEIADQTCALERTIGDSVVGYDLFDCDGALLGSVAAPGAIDDQLSFAQDVMQSRVVSYVSLDGDAFSHNDFEAATFPAALAPHDSGVVFAVLDARDTLRNPENFFATALESSLFAWDAVSGEIVPIESPGVFSAWTSRLEALPDGRVAILGPTGGLVARPPFDEWQQVWDMPDGASGVGIGMAISLDRQGIKVIVDDGAAAWVAHQGGPLTRVEAPASTEIVDVLIVTSKKVAALTQEGRVEWLDFDTQ